MKPRLAILRNYGKNFWKLIIMKGHVQEIFSNVIFDVVRTHEEYIFFKSQLKTFKGFIFIYSELVL